VDNPFGGCFTLLQIEGLLEARRGKEMSANVLAESLVLAIWIFTTAGITAISVMAGRKAVRK
jgi:hypothetical protein